MEDKKELTKDLLTLSFRELILKIPFDKITIKMITDGAGVIRPTFYKHFQDKYGILEYILQKEIREKIDVLIENHLENDIFLLLCSCLSKDRAFYKKLYLIEGPNSFEEQMFHIIRAFHVAGRCTDCGECSRVCPQHIPLHLLNRKFIKDINTYYGEYQAGAEEGSRAPLVNFTKEDCEPNVVYKGGSK